MGEWREIPELLRLTKTDIAVWLVTFALTVFADLTVAVEVGMILAALLFIRRVAETTTVSAVTDEYVRDGTRIACSTTTFRPMCASSASTDRSCSAPPTSCWRSPTRSKTLPDIVILRLRNMTALDGTGLRAIEELAEAVRRSGRELILCGARPQPARLMARADFQRCVGAANVCANVRDALARARQLHDAPQRMRGNVSAGI